MFDQSSLKLLLRARAELVAAMFLIGKPIRQKQTQDLALALMNDDELEDHGWAGPIRPNGRSQGNILSSVP